MRADRCKKHRLGLAVVGVLALLWGSYAQLAGTVWYVRPLAECANNGNGTAANCAASAGAAGAWRGLANVAWGSITAGDTLAVSGTFSGAAETDVSGITMRIDTSGTSASARVTVDCDYDDDGNKATFDGAMEVATGIRSAIVGTSQTTWTRVRDCVVRNYTSRGITNYNVTGDSTTDAQQIWQGVEIYNIGDESGADICFDGRGRYVTLQDVKIDGCGEDAVFTIGKYFSALYVSVDNFSRSGQVGGNGDGIQLGSGEQSNFLISGFRCTARYDSKQCFITSGSTDTGNDGVIEDFDVRCPRNATVNRCIQIESTRTQVRRGFIDGGLYNIMIGAAAATGVKVASVIGTNAAEDGLIVASNAGANNSIVNSVFARAKRHGVNVGTTLAQDVRNTIAVGNGSCGIQRADAANTEGYNDSYGNAFANFCLGASASAPSSTTAGTGSMSVDPLFIGGPNPTTARGFRLKSSSPLIGAGTCYLTGSCVHRDFDGRRHLRPPNIGAFATGFGDQK